MKYKALLLDLNGVLVKSPLLSDRFQSDFGLDLEVFLPALAEIMAKVRIPGAKPVYHYFQPYLESWGIKMNEKEFSKYWYVAEALNMEEKKFLKKIKNLGIFVIILSNNFSERASYYEVNFPELQEYVDKHYYSWKTGFIKPDPRAFKLVLEEFNLKPSEVIYFDDSMTNVKAAAELGIHSYLFSSLVEIERLLEE